MFDKKTLERFFDFLNERKMDEMSWLLAEGAELFFPKTRPLEGKDRILKFFKILFRQYPELSFQVQNIIIEGNRAAVHWKNRGISRKGDHYENEGVTLFVEESAGLIGFISDFFKDTEKF
jgi:ketosteroid isomerase-like protein